MSIYSIIKAIKNFFKPDFVAPAPAIAVAAPANRPKRRTRPGRWLDESFAEFDGTKAITVRAPRTLELRNAQISVCRHLRENYPGKRFKTHMNRERHTIRILPR